MSKKGLEKNVYSSYNLIEKGDSSYHSRERQLEENLKQLVSKFPQKDIENLKNILEQFDNLDLAIQEVEKNQQERMDAAQDVVNDDVFNYPSLPLEQENRFLKDSIISLYRDYLRQIKETERLKKELQLSNQKLKRVECLRNFIGQREES